MICLQKVSKSFDEKTALEAVTFSLNQDEVTALVGENGAGKTTLLNILTEEVIPDSGQVVNDHEIIGYLPQDRPLLEPYRGLSEQQQTNLA